MFEVSRKCAIGVLLGLTIWALRLPAQTSQRPGAAQAPPTAKTPTHADILRGEYGRYRVNWGGALS